MPEHGNPPAQAQPGYAAGKAQEDPAQDTGAHNPDATVASECLPGAFPANAQRGEAGEQGDPVSSASCALPFVDDENTLNAVALDGGGDDPAPSVSFGEEGVEIESGEISEPDRGVAPSSVPCPPFSASVSADGVEVSPFARSDAEERWPGLPQAPQEQELVALRALLFERELALIEQLKTRLDNPAEHAKDVSSVIAEALLLRASKDEKLALALEPVVEKIFKVSLRKNPLDFTNVLFPLMGPSIRRSIAEAFRSMLEGFNKSVEMAFSWKGLRWRFESIRTGKPFSEVVLLHTLLYRVEQVFFIHSDTGLVLAHVFDEGVDTQDADMVSAMLTAIQDFVRDCFASGAEGELESMQLGEFTILVEKNPQAYLACVVRGTPPVDFRQRLRTSLELMLVECMEALADFSGDTEPFTFARRYLEDCLVSRFVNEGKPLPLWVKAMPVVLLLALVGGAGFWVYAKGQKTTAAAVLRKEKEARLSAFHRSMEDAIEHLQQEPGLLMLEARRGDVPPWTLVCLRDELARDPKLVLAENGVPPENFTITVIPFVSYEPAIVTQRVQNKIRPPETVQMEFAENGTLRLSGTAPMHWILQARQAALALPGVKSIDMDALTDPRMEQLTALVRSVESVSVEFGLGKDMPVPSDLPELEKAVDDLVALEKLGKEMGVTVSLTVYGHADATGMDKRNYEISQARARTLAAMLYARGSSLPISLYGMGAEYADKNSTSPLGDQASRKIELRVHLAQAGDATPEVLKK